MRAFSLVELSIVLVILGLLTGGILTGQSLIRAAELRSIVTEYQRYLTATQSFRDKYMAIPGDMREATRFWGIQGGTGCTNRSGTAIVSPGTCDGDGDGLVTSAGVADGSTEEFQFWRQLALAGLIEGSYTGMAGSIDRTDYNFGSNAPQARISNVGWAGTYVNNLDGGVSYIYFYDYRNAFTIGGDDGALADEPFLKPEEAWNIDSKLDDGKPGTGHVIARTAGNGCSTSANGGVFAGDYSLDASSLSCSLIFMPSR